MREKKKKQGKGREKTCTPMHTQKVTHSKHKKAKKTKKKKKNKWNCNN